MYDLRDEQWEKIKELFTWEEGRSWKNGQE